MPNKQPPTESDMRTRVEEIARAFSIDCTDASEPLMGLIDRIREEVEFGLNPGSHSIEKMELDLDRFSNILRKQRGRSKHATPATKENEHV